MPSRRYIFLFFFFNDTATTEIYTLSLHDALPILGRFSRTLKFEMAVLARVGMAFWPVIAARVFTASSMMRWLPVRSEEHTSELQSRQYLVCRLLLEKKKKTADIQYLS